MEYQILFGKDVSTIPYKQYRILDSMLHTSVYSRSVARPQRSASDIHDREKEQLPRTQTAFYKGFPLLREKKNYFTV